MTASIGVLAAMTASVLSLWAPPPAAALSTPTIATTASGSGPLGGMVGDEAVLTGGSAESGSILFQLFEPGDPMCTGTPVFTSTVVVTGNGRYVSEPFWPSAPGAYRFLASYSGDLANAPASTLCGDAGETVTMTLASPTLVTTASGSVPVGGQVSDAALLSGGYLESGSITFTLFGPDDATCSLAPAFTQTVPIAYGGRYSSSPFTVTQPGTYRFVAAYSGDGENAPVATACGEQGETVLVTAAPVSPTLTVSASPRAIVGEQIRATVVLSAPGNPTGTITFLLYGPNDATCSGGAIASTTAVMGSGSYVSAPYTATVAGVYRFVATYSGDASFGSAASACTEPDAAVAVEPVPAPILARTFSVASVSGKVLVGSPSAGSAAAATRAHAGSIEYVQVTTPRSFPVGSIVDARGGSARVTTASNTRGGTQSGVFVGGPFRVLQSGGQRGLTQLVLLDGARAAGVCTRTARARAVTSRLPPSVIARLHSQVAGRFRTDARYSSASVHGTIWDTEDRCDGTLTRVYRGVVEVFDYRRHRSVILHAGMSYLAKAPR
jgi:hypothetical protein